MQKGLWNGRTQPGVVPRSVLFNQTQSTSNAQISREGVDYFVELPLEEEGPAQQKNEATHNIPKGIENLLIHGISQTLSLKRTRRDPTEEDMGTYLEDCTTHRGGKKLKLLEGPVQHSHTTGMDGEQTFCFKEFTVF
ncbi:hydrolase Nlp/P60 [Sesbania bispinosa]|nr:hydrolase Nlp/P60 [Sesbania bispinosa]